jgi:hypothetical protein
MRCAVNRIFVPALAVTITLLIFNNSFASVQRPTTHPPAKAKKTQSTIPSLNESERSSLRFQLENAWNEVDLIIRNANADKKDVERQEREFKTLQVFTKMPVATPTATQPGAIATNIRKSLQRYGLKLSEAKLLESSRPDRPIPAIMPREAQDFRFTEDQLVQKFRMELTLTGSKRQLQDWMNSWNTLPEPRGPNQPADTAPTLFLQWDPAALTSLPEMISESSWKVRAQAVYFRDIQYPKLQPQDPSQLLPRWAKENPGTFKSREPLLWSLVEKTRAAIPQALPKYEMKARFALNAARMTYFSSKVSRFE